MEVSVDIVHDPDGWGTHLIIDNACYETGHHHLTQADAILEISRDVDRALVLAIASLVEAAHTAKDDFIRELWDKLNSSRTAK